jgi:predicted MPP superfamily phosphohydrolase
MIFFRIVVPLLILGIQYSLYRRAHAWVKQRFSKSVWPGRVLLVAFLAFNIAFIFVSIVRPRPSDFPEWFLYTGVYPFYIWHGALFFIGLVVIVSGLIKLVFNVILKVIRVVPSADKSISALTTAPAFQRFDSSRRVFLRRSMYGLTAVSFGSSAYGLILGKSSHQFTSAEFVIESLPSELDGFTIGLMSDIHSSVYMTKEEMEEYVRLMNSQNTDLVVVTGDFVNSMVDEVYPFAEAFSNLKAPFGVYGVMGNHDFFARDPELVAREVDACGVSLLRNDSVIITKNGKQFSLVGVDDTGRAERAGEKMDIALRNTPSDFPRVLLCHRPYFFQQAADRNLDLVLSGHTHGGQVSLGQIGGTVIAPASLASPYVWGKYTIGRTGMYVSRGIGTVGLPIRINCPPEITRIILRSPARS